MSFVPMRTNLVGAATQHASVKDRIAAALQRAVAASRSPAKELARRLGRTPNGAGLLLRGEVSPSAETLIQACREFDEVWEEFRELCGRGTDRTDMEAALAGLDELAAKLRERRAG